MSDHIFISYARADGTEFARRLHKDLTDKGLSVWLDEFNIPPGSDWDDEIDKGLEEARAIVLLLTPAAVLSQQVKAEWNSALNRNQPLLPLFVITCDVPRVVAVFNYIDFRGGYDPALQSLMDKLARIDSEHLNYLHKLLDAYKVAQDGADNPLRFESKIESLQTAISRWETRTSDQASRIASGLEQERQQRTQAAVTGAERLHVVGRKPVELTDFFKDRVYERRQLRDLLVDERSPMISVIARGGMGKTALVCRVLDDIEREINLNVDGALPIAGITYLSTRTAGLDLERLFLDIARTMGDVREQALLSVWTSPKLSIEQKIDELIAALNDNFYIVMLDNMEDLQDAEGNIGDNDVAQFLTRALPGLKQSTLIVTTRVPLQFPATLTRYDKHILIQDGLPTTDGVQLLNELDPNGEYGIQEYPDDKLVDLVELGHGVPRALEVMVAILANDPFMSVDDLLRSFTYHDDRVKELVMENYRRLSEDAQRVLEAIAVYGQPVSILAIDYLLEPFYPGLHVPEIIRYLSRIHIVSIDRSTKTVTLHPIDRDYAYTQIPRDDSPASDSTYCVTHVERRAADYYTKFHTVGNWSKLDDVSSFIQEFEHRVKGAQYAEAAVALSQIANFLSFQGHVYRLQQMTGKLEGQLQDGRGYTHYHYAMALMRMAIGPLDDAVTHFQTAIDSLTEADEGLRGKMLFALGDTYRYIGDTEKSIHYLAQAADAPLNLEDELHTLMTLSMSCTTAWRLREAVDYAQRGVDKAAEKGEAVAQAKAYNALAVAYLAARSDRKALEYALEALKHYAQFEVEGGSAKNGVSFMLQLTGLAQMTLGNLDEAFAQLDKAHTNTVEFNLARVRGFVLFNLAVAHRMRDEHQLALEAAKKSRQIFAEVGLTHIDVQPLENACRAHLDHDKAGEAAALRDCANEASKSPDLYNPLYFAESARDIANEVGDSELVAELEQFISAYAEKATL